MKRKASKLLPSLYGLASVVKDGKCGLVDYSNNVVAPPLKYDDIISYEGGGLH